MELDEQQRRTLVWIGAIALAVLLLAALSAQNKNNQIVPLLPGGDPPPVVPDLPDLVAQLRTAKSLCEGRASAAIDLFQGHPQRVAALADGRRLYDEAKAEFDGCITYLSTGLSRRFVEGDSAKIAARLADGRRKADAFVAWANDLQPKTSYGASGPLDDVLRMVDDWMKRANEQNEQAIKQLRDDLEACRLREWNNIGQ